MTPRHPRGFVVEVEIKSSRADTVLADSWQDAVQHMEQRFGGRAVVTCTKVVEVAYCSGCGAFRDIGEKRKAHMVPGCRGRWSA